MAIYDDLKVKIEGGKVEPQEFEANGDEADENMALWVIWDKVERYVAAQVLKYVGEKYERGPGDLRDEQEEQPI